jgi:hypothetical protein
MDDFIHAPSSLLNDAIVMCEQLGSAGHVTLFRAVQDRQINLIIVARGTPISDAALNRSKRPMIVLLGDDDGAGSGPTGFRSWRRLRTWAGCGLIHAAAADVSSYSVAVALATLQGKLLLVETSAARAPEWVDALRASRIPAVGVLPRGGQHPVRRRRKSNGGGRA